jgi:glucose-6-phosphate dehydrogenase assembly protein OpcA
MGVVADVERQLAQLRCRELEQDEDAAPELRTSTATHLVWAPPRWLPEARRTLRGLAERHPSRVVFLVPEPGRRDAVESRVAISEYGLDEGREVFSELIELRLRGTPARHPGSVVLPLLIADLPAFCRWRGEPDWASTAFREIVDASDRLIVDSGEWSGLPGAYGELAACFGEHLAVSDIAYRRTLPWRAQLADAWPGIRRVSKLRVEGPRAEALLLAGWLRSRLSRDIALVRRSAATVAGVWVDGSQLDAPPSEPSPSDLLSAEMDMLARDHVYEDAVAAVA